MATMASPFGGYDQGRGSFLRALDKAEHFLKSKFGVDADAPVGPEPLVDDRPPMPSRYALARNLSDVATLLTSGEPTRPIYNRGIENPLTSVIRRLPASERGRAVTAMLDFHADPTHNCGTGRKPLEEAARAGDPKVIGILMDRGATFGASEFKHLIDGAKDRLRLARDAGSDIKRGHQILGELKEGLSEAFRRMGGEDNVKRLLRHPEIQRELDGSAILRETIHDAQQVFDTRDWTQKTKVGINLSGPKVG